MITRILPSFKMEITPWRMPIKTGACQIMPFFHLSQFKKLVFLIPPKRLPTPIFFRAFLWLSPCWSVLDFWKIKLEKSSSTNWIFSLQKSISKLIFAGYIGSKNPVRNRLKIQLAELDFSNLIFQKSSTDG